jgi:small subunit ribosomal protein S1
MSESFAELFEESFASQQIKPGSIITGTVVAVNDDVVIVSAGLKSEAVIPIEQFKNDKSEDGVAVGDEVEVALDAVEDGFGETKLSREKAIRARTWIDLEKAFEESQVVEGVINGRVKGGFTVEIDSVRAFLPGSLVDVRPVRDPGYLEGKSLEFKVIKLDKRRNNVVVSRRAVVEQEYSAEREALLEDLQEGNMAKGIVKNLTDYGAFVDLGGIDGLLHITDMAWKRVKHPSEVVEVGQEIDVKILKFDRERQRVSLGMKQLGDDPWKDLARRYPQQTRIFGKITNIADYGCFVEIEDGVEGLVHVSEMDWTNKNVNPARVVSVGEEVEVMVIEKGGIDGLVHLSDISWEDVGEEAVRNYKKGQEIDAAVLAIDAERERISLGIKQLEKDPFSAWLAEHPKNSIVKGVVTEVDARAATIDLGEGIEGSLRASEMARGRVEDARTMIKVGEEVEAKFTNVDRKNRTIALSIKAKEVHDEQEAISSYKSEAGAAPVGTTLGELLKEKMSGGSK